MISTYTLNKKVLIKLLFYFNCREIKIILLVSIFVYLGLFILKKLLAIHQFLTHITFAKAQSFL